MKYIISKDTVLKKEQFEKNNRFQSNFIIRNNNEEIYLEIENKKYEYNVWTVQKILYIFLFLCEQTDSEIEFTKRDLMKLSDAYPPNIVKNLEMFLQKQNPKMVEILSHIKRLSYLNPRELIYIKHEISQVVGYTGFINFRFQSKLLKDLEIRIEYNPYTKEIICEKIMVHSLHRPVDFFNLYGKRFQHGGVNLGSGCCEEVRKKTEYLLRNDLTIRMKSLFDKNLKID